MPAPSLHAIGGALAVAHLLLAGTAHAGRTSQDMDLRVAVGSAYLQARAVGPGSGAWALTVARDETPPALPSDATRDWSEPGAVRTLAERLSLNFGRNPSVEGRRVRQVSVELRLPF